MNKRYNYQLNTKMQIKAEAFSEYDMLNPYT